jgi:hypothetical protein
MLPVPVLCLVTEDGPMPLEFVPPAMLGDAEKAARMLTAGIPKGSEKAVYAVVMMEPQAWAYNMLIANVMDRAVADAAARLRAQLN